MTPANPTTRKRPAPAAKPPAETPPAPPEAAPADPQQPAKDLGVVIPKSDGSQPAAPPPETIPVFTYDGTTYSMPLAVSLQTSLFAIRVISIHGGLPGGIKVLERVLGQDALGILLTAPEIEDEHLSQVIDKVIDHILLKSERTEEETQGE